MKEKYIVDAYKVFEEFTTERGARAYFEEIKHNHTYCELKKATVTDNRYYAKSLEIFRK